MRFIDVFRFANAQIRLRNGIKKVEAANFQGLRIMRLRSENPIPFHLSLTMTNNLH